jgi:hypothetical protein
MKLPPRIYNEAGRLRRVGFELEFSGLEIADAADVLAQVLQGQVRRTGEFTAEVDSSCGLFRVEFDSTFFQHKHYEKYLDVLGLHPRESELGRELEYLLFKLGEVVIPFEVVTPPLPLTDIDVVEKLREALCRHSAQGTKSAPFRAFGLQFNPEVPDKSVSTLLSYLRAFFLLFDWLFEESDVPLARCFAPYIQDFPREYMRTVVDPDYRPSLEEFMTDYLRHNPTRNRPLDLLPLFADLDAELVFRFPVEKHKIKPRPAFHYRLPNSDVDNPEWTIAVEWERWLKIEDLAADPLKLARMGQEYLAFQGGKTRRDWVLHSRSQLDA